MVKASVQPGTLHAFEDLNAMFGIHMGNLSWCWTPCRMRMSQPKTLIGEDAH